MYWHDAFCNLTLSTIHEIVLLPLLVIGMLWGDRRIFFSAINNLLLAMLLAAALKAYFQVPLAPHLHKDGFAFPSGHMLTATAFYGGLLIMTPHRWVRWALAGNLVCFAYALVARGYHNTHDVAAAVWFACLLLGATHTLQHRSSRLVFALWSAAFASVCVLSCAWFYQMPPHAWMAYGLLCGFLAGNTLTLDSPLDNLANASKIFALCTWLGLGILAITSPLPTSLVTVCGWGILGSALPLTTRLFAPPKPQLNSP